MDAVRDRVSAAAADGGAPTGAERRARGLWIAFLGADGSGKTSVIDRLEAAPTPAWSGMRRFHLRPHFGLRDPKGPPVPQPHAARERGLLTTLAKLFAWWLDSTIGWWLVVRPELERGKLVVFDRCVRDLLVDPRRYRYRGPDALAEALVATIPEPDLFFVLDAPPEVLRARKREVPAEEVIRQREAYRAMAERFPDAVLIDASRPLEEVVDAVEARIEEARRTAT